MKKKIISLFLALATVLPFVPVFKLPVSAATSGITGDCTWTLDGTVLTISGNGRMGDYSEVSPWGTTITEVIIEDGVTSIGNSVFRYFTDIESVTLGKDVKSIGEDAFYHCTSLEFINIPNSVTSIGSGAFYECTALKAIALGNRVESIEVCTFTNCTSLESIEIPDSVTFIGTSAFAGCNKLRTITLGSGVKSIGEDAFAETAFTFIEIPDSVTFIGEGAFYFSAIEIINIGSGLKSISNYAFPYCSSLASITVSDENDTYHSAGNCLIETKSKTLIVGGENATIPTDGSVTSIGSFSFHWRPLKAIDIPNDITSIGTKAFFGCKDLTSVTIPSSVTSIGFDAFYDTAWFKNQPDGLVYAGKVAYKIKGDYPETIVLQEGTVGIAAYAFSYCDSLTSVELSDGLIEIGSNAFEGCTSLGSISIPDGVTSIGEGAFEGCSSLESITVSDENPYYHSDFNCLIETESKTLILGCKSSVIPSDGSVTSIGENAFHNCSSITSINIPNGVTSIGASAFYGCKGLTSVTIPSSVTFISEYAFCGCTGLTAVHISDLKPWCEIVFSNDYSNPLRYAENLYVNGEQLMGTLVFPKELTKVRDYTFQGCTSFTGVEIHDKVTEIEKKSFYNCSSITSINIPNSITTIGTSAFEGCTGLTAVHISDLKPWCEIVFLNDYSNPLRYAENLYVNGEQLMGTLVFPKELTKIRDYTFQGCTSFTSVEIHDKVTEIGTFAFNECRLTDFVIPGSVKTINWGAFSQNFKLKSVTIEKGVEVIDYGVFFNCTFESITLPDSVTTIGTSAFEGCASLKSIIIPDSVTSIGSCAFSHCYALKSIIIPDSVIFIDGNTFEYCYSLESVSFSNSIISIDRYAFSQCGSLTNVWFEGTPEKKAELSIEFGNDSLLNATWHYVDGDCDEECNECKANRKGLAPHTYDNAEDMNCNVCNALKYTPGDLDGVVGVTSDDAIYLLFAINFPDSYPTTQPCDFDGSGEVTTDDAIYLLFHINFSDSYPLH